MHNRESAEPWSVLALRLGNVAELEFYGLSKINANQLNLWDTVAVSGHSKMFNSIKYLNLLFVKPVTVYLTGKSCGERVSDLGHS